MSFVKRINFTTSEFKVFLEFKLLFVCVCVWGGGGGVYT